MTLILIVDDEPVVREPLRAALQNTEYDIVSASNGADALLRIGERTPDLVLLDIAMPMMDGLTLLRALRKREATRHVPVLMLTNSTDRGVVVAAAALGIKGYILKQTFNLDQIRSQISRAIHGAGGGPPGAFTADVNGPAHEASDSTSQTVATDMRTHSPEPDPRSRRTMLEERTDLTTDDRDAAFMAIKPIMTKAAVMDALGACLDLKGFSPAVSEALHLTGTPNCAAAAVAQAIARDPAMAIKVLELANSALYTRGERVDNVLKAVLRIGLSQIRQALTNLAVIDGFSAPPPGSGIELGKFWEHSIATGLVAAELARDRGGAEVAFTIGLLHDVGRLVLVEQLGSSYQHVLDAAHQYQVPLEQAEQRLLGTTHAKIMDQILRRRQFSSELVRAIGFHHVDPHRISHEVPQDAAAVATIELADRLTHAMMWGSSGNETIYSIEGLCTQLGVDNDGVARLLPMVREQKDRTLQALLVTAADMIGEPRVTVHRRCLRTPMRPMYLSACLQPDACRLFVNELAATNLDDRNSPNIAIVYTRSVKDREAVSSRLLQSEQIRGVQSLPLLVISPGGHVAPDPGLVENRRMACLGLPFRIERFISAVNTLLECDVATQAA